MNSLASLVGYDYVVSLDAFAIRTSNISKTQHTTPVLWKREETTFSTRSLSLGI